MGIENIAALLKVKDVYTPTQLKLEDFVKRIKKYKEHDKNAECFIGIDIDNMLFKHGYAHYGMTDARICNMVLNMIKCGATPIAFIDGEPSKLKENTHKKRSESIDKRNDRFIELKDKLIELGQADCMSYRKILVEMENVSKYRKIFNRQDKIDIKNFLEVIGIQVFVINRHEPEAIMSYLMKKKKLDAVITTDTDVLLYCYDCGYLIKNNKNNCDEIEACSINKIHKAFDMDLNKFRFMAYLMGTDFTKKFMTPAKAYKEVVNENITSVEIMKELYNDSADFIESVRLSIDFMSDENLEKIIKECGVDIKPLNTGKIIEGIDLLLDKLANKYDKEFVERMLSEFAQFSVKSNQKVYDLKQHEKDILKKIKNDLSSTSTFIDKIKMKFEKF